MSGMDISRTLVLIRGAGDVGSGVARRLFLAGFPVLLTELPEPLCIRRTVAFSDAVFDGSASVEGVTARRATLEQLSQWNFEQSIPLLVDPDGRCILQKTPDVVVDARLLKGTPDTRLEQATVVAGLGPGFTAGDNCHFAVETARGHTLGRVLYHGSPEPDSGLPAVVQGHTAARAIYTTQAGRFEAEAQIAQVIAAGATLARIDGTPVICEIAGTVRGILRHGLYVPARTKIADVDPRGRPDFCYTVSDRTNAIAGGVLEGILAIGRNAAVPRC